MGEESVVGLIISAGIVQEVDLTPTYSICFGWKQDNHIKGNWIKTRQIPQTVRLIRIYCLQLHNAIFFISSQVSLHIMGVGTGYVVCANCSLMQRIDKCQLKGLLEKLPEMTMTNYLV